MSKDNVIIEHEPPKRYESVPYSQSAHCCFEYTVVDTTKPHMIGNEHYRDRAGNLHYEAVCECFEEAAAILIAQALNEQDERNKRELAKAVYQPEPNDWD
jgi:hypothetical protein